MNIPTIASLGEWHVGKNARGENEVRFVLADKGEAQAWLFWLLNHVTDDEGLEIGITVP